jgi:hypothetical protein
VLPSTSESVTVTPPLPAIAPASAPEVPLVPAVLFEIVEPVTVRTPVVKMPPPKPPLGDVA